MLVVITGGGTGGHILPAMAIREAFIQRGVDVLYIGSKNGIEAKIVDKNARSLFLNLKGIKGKSFLKALEGASLTVAAFLKLLFQFLSLRPAVVIGTGGFVCFPAVLAGFFCGSKIYLQEQNAVPGASVKLLSRLAKAVFLGFDAAKEFLPRDKCVFTGNPIRKEFIQGKINYEPHIIGEKMKILVLGGSQGAGFINKLVTESLMFLDRDKFCFIHQAGEKNRKTIERKYREHNFESEVIGFSPEIHKHYFQAHLIISRAGAMTLTEIIASRRPSLLIPFPFAIYDHQTKNAEAIVSIGGAKLFTETEITPQLLSEILSSFYDHPHELMNMSKSLSVLKLTDAADFITETIMEDINCTKRI